FAIGVPTVMSVGRVAPWFSTCSAWLSAAVTFFEPVVDEPEVELLLDEPQAASAPAAAIAVTAATTALRRERRTTDVRVDMVTVSSLWFEGTTRSQALARRSRASENRPRPVVWRRWMPVTASDAIRTT